MGNRRRIDRAERARRIRTIARRLGLLVLRLCLLAGLAGGVGWGADAGWRWLTTTPHLAIETIEIEGNERASDEEVLRLSGLARGDNLLRANLVVARARLLGHPWIREVAIERRFPQGIGIAVVERRPAALVDLEHLYLLDDRGEVFKRAMPGDPVDLPVITGLPRETWAARREEAQQRLDEALHALAAWRTRDRARRLPVAEVHLDEGEGVTLYLGDRGPAVKLGHGDFESHLERP